ncbi:hypothetical protein BJV82DRAFT_608831 [Fennellomyces sp. T-0311]|nr:hypothetical protein BJV82DRAFT_608831 [Fennellomyces sp. T-0311]
MVRTKKQAVASVNSSQAIQPSTKHGNPILPGDHSLPWNPNLYTDQPGCQKDRSHEANQNLREYVQRERDRKTQRILSNFGQLSQEEVDVMLMDCGCNEDEVIKRLQNRPDYLEGIRKIMSTVIRPAAEKAAIVPASTLQPQQPTITHQPIATPAIQPAPFRPAPHPQTNVQTITESTAALFKRDSKKRSRMTGRLALDDALKQIKADPNKAFEGWSQARVRAFQMIEQNPNSYYYRFNAPGEEQRKGAWTEDEKELFFKRLREVGANGQWGIFSTAIPGRVGYQCSNYYRLLIESGQLHDPNYIVDEKGKAHYLFDKRGSDGRVEKTFRTHSPHTFGANKRKSPSSTAKKNADVDDDGDTSGTFSMSLRSSARIAAKNHTRSKTVP